MRTKSLWDDETYLKLIYRFSIDKKLNLENPETFTEKIQWLKLNDRNPQYTNLVDKVKVKDYVEKKIGKEYIIPTIAVYDKAEDIDFNSLPDKFVMKCNHDSGTPFICKNKADLDSNKVRKQFKKLLERDYYLALREWPYKNVERKIIVEEFITPPDIRDLRDYKFFCFNGEPKFFKIDFGRFSDHHSNYYDLNWNLLQYEEHPYPRDPLHKEEKPKNFDLMVSIAKKLSEGFSFIRVDLYNIKGKIYFGELTLYPGSGFIPWKKTNHDSEIGKLLHLS